MRYCNMIMVLFFLVVLSCRPQEPPGVADIGQNAPDFTLKDLQGKKVTLSSYRNKVVLIEFWATWCPPCRMTIPELVKLTDEYADKDFTVLSINVDEGRDVETKLNEFIDEFGINYPVLLADNLTIRLYGIVPIPISFLLDRKHTIVKKYTGYVERKDLKEEIERLLKDHV